MIKILKNTMIDPIEKTCKYCGSIFTFNYEDIKREECTNFIGFTHTNIYVVCPVCKKSLSIEDDDHLTKKEN